MGAKHQCFPSAEEIGIHLATYPTSNLPEPMIGSFLYSSLFLYSNQRFFLEWKCHLYENLQSTVHQILTPKLPKNPLRLDGDPREIRITKQIINSVSEAVEVLGLLLFTVERLIAPSHKPIGMPCVHILSSCIGPVTLIKHLHIADHVKEKIKW